MTNSITILGFILTLFTVNTQATNYQFSNFKFSDLAGTFLLKSESNSLCPESVEVVIKNKNLYANFSSGRSLHFRDVNNKRDLIHEAFGVWSFDYSLLKTTNQGRELTYHEGICSGLFAKTCASKTTISASRKLIYSHDSTEVQLVSYSTKYQGHDWVDLGGEEEWLPVYG